MAMEYSSDSYRNVLCLSDQVYVHVYVHVQV